ncbi:LCP family protein [Microbacterium sp. STN6]|uniref:LCP family protein n=1 Tax=Microbacterium sp. STN6 TaxID=2995588 RepID=UPI002260FD0A|nr:LCP family protein [Microbacterium sp. STN6]MCX7520849.1 LCP family protein [Microbacterium sp. STN6]
MSKARERTPISHARLRSRPGLTLVRWLLSAVAVVAVSGVAVAAVATWDVARSFKPPVALEHTEGEHVPSIGAYEGGLNFLLVGDDSGGGNPAYGKRGEKLNDVTVLIHLDGDHKNATIVTFPRDMFVKIPSCPREGGGHYSAMSSQKINVSYSYGGLPCTAKTVEELTGLTVSYAADVAFDGAIAIADAVGGVEVCLADPIIDRYTNPPLDLPAGTVKLEGPTAISFLRSRHGVGDGSDLGRVSNQQLFFAALVRQTRDQLSDIPRLYKIAKVAAKNMTLSENLSDVGTLVQIALAFKNIDFDSIVFVQYPNHYPGGQEPDVNGVLPTKAAAEQLMTALRDDKPVVLTGGTGGAGATQLDTSQPTPPAEAGGAQTTDAAATPGSADGAVTLPDNVYGQTAAQHTCTVQYHG